MSKMLRRSARRSIFRSFGRFLAIFAIIAIGVGFFSGLTISKDEMRRNGNNYLEKMNMFDFHVIAPFGANADEIESIGQISGVLNADGAYRADALASVDSGDESVFRFHSVTRNVNKLDLVSGKFPEKGWECVIDARYFDSNIIGKQIVLSNTNSEETLDKIDFMKLTVVGVVTSPIYLNYERGSTSVGNGSVSAFVYLPECGFISDYYDEVYVDFDIPGEIYSKKYNDALELNEDKFVEEAGKILSKRFDDNLEEMRAEVKKNEEDLKAKELLYLSEKAKVEKQLESTKAELDRKKQELEDALVGTDEKIKEAGNKILALKEAIGIIDAELPKTQDESMKTELEYNRLKLLYELDEAEKTLETLVMIRDSRDQAEKELSDAYAEYEASKSEIEGELRATEREIIQAKNKIEKAYKDLEYGINWDECTLTRRQNTGYVCFENDTDIVDAIAKVFPIFFFAVAALVCMTTMARMVDEERTEIGTLRALGYRKREIRVKYLTYSGVASVLGCLFGFALGTYLLPKLIRFVYRMMYDFKDSVTYYFAPWILVISLAATLVCSLGVTWFSLRNTFKQRPATLMRPTAPENGGRILLEKTGKLWDNMSFLHKVTARNIFRYKKRMAMMIVGIGGCTALLLTGFGLRDSIYNVLDNQFGGVTLYDSAIILSDEYKGDQSFREDFSEELKDVEDFLPLMQFSADAENGENVKGTSVLVFPNEEIGEFFRLHDGKKKIDFPAKGEIAISKGLAEAIGAEDGEIISLRDSDMTSYMFRISGIFDNYIGNYVVLSEESFIGEGGAIKYNTVYLKHLDGTVPSEVGATFSGSGKVLSVTVNDDVKERTSNMLESMNIIIVIVVVCAGALAFVVIANLTNINITERKREIATLKVLGFTQKECSKYVFRENNILTAFGAVFGIPLGILLHAYCMNRIKIESVYFETNVNLISYFIAFLMTLLFALLVNVFMRRKIENVDMASSLKSTE